MPRFYFDVRDGDQSKPDLEGLEFADADEARVEASRALADMVKDAMPDGTHRDIAIEVRDEHGTPVLTVQITFAVRRPS